MQLISDHFSVTTYGGKLEKKKKKKKKRQNPETVFFFFLCLYLFSFLLLKKKKLLFVTQKDKKLQQTLPRPVLQVGLELTAIQGGEGGCIVVFHQSSFGFGLARSKSLVMAQTVQEGPDGKKG